MVSALVESGKKARVEMWFCKQGLVLTLPLRFREADDPYVARNVREIKGPPISASGEISLFGTKRIEKGAVKRCSREVEGKKVCRGPVEEVSIDKCQRRGVADSGQSSWRRRGEGISRAQLVPQWKEAGRPAEDLCVPRRHGSLGREVCLRSSGSTSTADTKILRGECEMILRMELKGRNHWKCSPLRAKHSQHLKFTVVQIHPKRNKGTEFFYNRSWRKGKRRKGACEDWLLNIHEDPNFLAKVITGDETWVYGYDPETKQQSSQWLPKNAPKLKKARMSKSKNKGSLGIVHYEFLQQGQTINQHRFYIVYGNPYERNDRKSGSRANGYFITITPQHTELFPWHVDNASSPVYALLAPNDFFFFPKMKSVLKGHRFDTINSIKEKSVSVLRGITSDEFSGCFRNWEKRMKHCIDSLGQYFEQY
ncbi:hypothetical protein LAZ67_12002073 [Cordylochernes scorpioides]|uniref:Uncharacterized protein n=1 Tax=Cordylochernes scorpioides TaxID=51811 RepID=A0ABY6L3G1_9ARAC|nr:hypothetical protein LAZ67_12002073 [Cordylochernes scorpioides]